MGGGVVEEAGARVVIGHADGVQTRYIGLRAAVKLGETVAAGQVIGTAEGECVWVEALRDGCHIDPESLLE